MLEIINNLKPFFEDCYRRISVREYSRITKISPPTASKILNNYSKLNLLIKEEDRNYLFFHANNKDKQFIALSIIYWGIKLRGLTDLLEKKLISPTIILFGSLSKGETKQESDIDVAIFANKKDLDIEDLEKKVKRKIQIFWFKSLNDIKNKDLANNIINGSRLVGRFNI
ncbi:hypothetical protein CMI42_04950 [Candidatus Pacearchaeota archaeon]|nr:hypothetical protein [Candidatus Pacearchaeota archaeon]|tara:strand:+ start:1405 stop:1914 length:510 start_codon:yes stop_codon:yes gene_type:complete